MGAVATPAPYDRSQNEWANQYRTYFQDVWKIKPNFTVNYGLAWNTQNGFYNSDLAKPQFLAPILGTGSNNLGPTVNNTKEFQPAFGFAWSPGKSQKWVIRGGGGIYWDSTPYYYKLRESPVIGPLGDGRVTLAASAFTNNIAGPFGGSGVLQIGGSTSTCPIPRPALLGRSHRRACSAGRADHHDHRPVREPGESGVAGDFSQAVPVNRSDQRAVHNDWYRRG